MPQNRKFRRWLMAAVLLALPSFSRGQIFTWSEQGDAQNNPWLASMVRSGFAADQDQAAARQLAAHPPGRRCLFLWSENHSVFNNVADGADLQTKIYWPAGIAEAKTHCARIISALSDAAIKPDVVLLDEEEGPVSWSMSDAQMITVASDPRYCSLGWPTLPISTEADRDAFDEVIQTLERSALREGILNSFEQYAPDALTCNFGEQTSTREEAALVPDPNGHPYAMPTLSGNSQAPGMYLHPSGYAPTYNNYSLTVYGVNMLRTAVRHSPVLPWYIGDGPPDTWTGSPYREELTRHGLLTCGIQGMLFDPIDGEKSAAHLSTLLFDLRKACNGTLPATLLTTDISDYNTQWFVSARVDTDSSNAVTRLLARVTFAPGVTKARLVIAGQTFNITRPARQTGAWVRWTRSNTKALY